MEKKEGKAGCCKQVQCGAVGSTTDLGARVAVHIPPLVQPPLGPPRASLGSRDDVEGGSQHATALAAPIRSHILLGVPGGYIAQLGGIHGALVLVLLGQEGQLEVPDSKRERGGWVDTCHYMMWRWVEGASCSKWVRLDTHLYPVLWVSILHPISLHRASCCMNPSLGPILRRLDWTSYME